MFWALFLLLSKLCFWTKVFWKTKNVGGGLVSNAYDGGLKQVKNDKERRRESLFISDRQIDR